MKKIGLACFLALTMCFTLYAGALEDTQFKQYVEINRNSKDNPEGMTVCADSTYRIIYFSMPTTIDFSSVNPQVMKNMKQAMLKEISKLKDDIKIIRNLKINLVYTFITSDKNIFTITISYKDF